MVGPQKIALTLRTEHFKILKEMHFADLAASDVFAKVIRQWVIDKLPNDQATEDGDMFPSSFNFL